MAEERRSAPRARISGARVTYESATGDQTETDALNLGRGGLFVRATKPLAVGKRLALEIQVAGELVPWSALGRVVWVRGDGDGDRRPPGMGVKLIDVDDAVVATIERLVAERENTEPGVGAVERPTRPAAATPGPAREKTILGVGSSFPAPVTAANQDAIRAQSSPQRPGREPSMPIDLVGRDVAVAHSSPPGSRRNEEAWQARPSNPTPSATPPASKSGGAGRWLVVLVVLAVAAAAVYLLLDGDLVSLQRPSAAPASPQGLPFPAALPPSTAIATASGAVPAQSATASPALTAVPTTTTAASSAPVPSFSSGPTPRTPPATSPVPPHSRPATAAKKPVADEGNPY